MKIINPCVELIQQESGFDGMIRHIEKCGRTCYKSKDKITQDSADSFVDNLLKNKHYAMLEHGTVYLKIPEGNSKITYDYKENPYSIIKYTEDFAYVTTNYRVLIENNWIDDLQFICEPTECHVPRITLKFTTNIGVTREGNRMRANSIAEESTRYCNYTKDKFNNTINICPPAWFRKNDIEAIEELDESDWIDLMCNTFDTSNPDFYNLDAIQWYCLSITMASVAYRNLIKLGWTPQQAREVLPLATKSEVVYTAFPHQWKHFFDLRLFGTTGKPHPNMKWIAELAQDVLEQNNLWNLIYNPDVKTNNYGTCN